MSAHTSSHPREILLLNFPPGIHDFCVTKHKSHWVPSISCLSHSCPLGQKVHLILSDIQQSLNKYSVNEWEVCFLCSVLSCFISTENLWDGCYYEYGRGGQNLAKPVLWTPEVSLLTPAVSKYFRFLSLNFPITSGKRWTEWSACNVPGKVKLRPISVSKRH